MSGMVPAVDGVVPGVVPAVDGGVEEEFVPAHTPLNPPAASAIKDATMIAKIHRLEKIAVRIIGFRPTLKFYFRRCLSVKLIWATMTASAPHPGRSTSIRPPVKASSPAKPRTAQRYTNLKNSVKKRLDPDAPNILYPFQQPDCAPHPKRKFIDALA